jgi:hypothetical protein
LEKFGQLTQRATVIAKFLASLIQARPAANPEFAREKILPKLAVAPVRGWLKKESGITTRCQY